MGVFSRFRRRRTPYRALSDEERIARYVYLLNTLPASVIESAHASAFREMPAERRREMFEQLRPFMAESERDAASDDPTVLARLVRRAEEHRAQRAAGGADAGTTATATATRPDAPWVDPRDGVDVRGMLATSGVMLLMANNVLASTAVVSYYTMGAGSLQLESEPGWVGETFDPGLGFDGGGAGAGAGDFGGGGGGVDGGLGGGFDGGFGGFSGGGFDGGGGFGG